ncbi:MAG: hypothetical protein AB7G93_23465 [Bdellovibrionales bacterium]
MFALFPYDQITLRIPEPNPVEQDRQVEVDHDTVDPDLITTEPIDASDAMAMIDPVSPSLNFSQDQIDMFANDTVHGGLQVLKDEFGGNVDPMDVALNLITSLPDELHDYALSKLTQLNESLRTEGKDMNGDDARIKCLAVVAEAWNGLSPVERRWLARIDVTTLYKSTTVDRLLSGLNRIRIPWVLRSEARYRKLVPDADRWLTTVLLETVKAARTQGVSPQVFGARRWSTHVAQIRNKDLKTLIGTKLEERNKYASDSPKHNHLVASYISGWIWNEIIAWSKSNKLGPSDLNAWYFALPNDEYDFYTETGQSDQDSRGSSLTEVNNNLMSLIRSID